MRARRTSFVRMASGFLVLGAAIAAYGQEYVISTFAGGAPPPTPVLGIDIPLGTLQSVTANDGWVGGSYLCRS
jgi:hypothetical protein